MDKPLISVRQFSQRSGLSYRVARRLVLAGEVPSIKVGSRRRVSAEFIQDWKRQAGSPQLPPALIEDGGRNALASQLAETMLGLGAFPGQERYCYSILRAVIDSNPHNPNLEAVRRASRNSEELINA
jgi:excisionase family DNA binding protein